MTVKRLVTLSMTLAVAQAGQAHGADRVNAAQKGSLLVFPKVELRWNSAGEPIQDVFLDLTNDYPDDVLVQLYFVNGDPPLEVSVGQPPVGNPTWHVAIDVSTVAVQNLEIEFALYDNSGVIGDSWALIDNVVYGAETEDFEDGTLGGFDASLNPASVQVINDTLDGSGSKVMHIAEDPVLTPTYVFRDFVVSGAGTIEFDFSLFGSGLVGPYGLDELVVSILDADTLSPLLPGLTPGFGDVVAANSNGLIEVDGVTVSPIAAVEPYHPGWNWVDVAIPLTHNEPTYWSMMTGAPIGMQPFTILDPAGPGQLPGRPDPEGGEDRVMRGYVIAWAVNELNQEIRWNHLLGDAVIVDYLAGAAWEYNAWVFQATDSVAHGAPTGTPGDLHLDGSEFQFCYDQLLLEFYAVHSMALSGGGRMVSVDTDLTLHPVSADLRQDSVGPVTTKAHFDIWDMNEFKKSGTYRCITCWDQTCLSNYRFPNNFLLENLWTDRGKARISGVASQLCNVDFDPTNGPLGADPRDVVSVSTPLLGVATKRMVFDGGADHGLAGSNVFGLGYATALIRADLVSGGGAPPETPSDGVGETANVAAGALSRVSPEPAALAATQQ